MNKKLVLLLTIIMVATLVFVACDQTAEYEGKFDDIPDRAYAVESEYVVEVAYELKFGEEVPYPLMTEMENLSKQRVINGAFSTRALKIGSNIDGDPGVVFDTYEIMFESANLISVRFIANEKMNAQDEAVNFLFAATKDGKLMMNALALFGRVDANPNVETAYSVFSTYQEEQGMEARTFNEFLTTLFYFTGEDEKNLTINFIYLKENQNTVSILFSEILEYATQGNIEFFEFTK
ncbi:MAG: hypothetical protein KAG94_03145 [Clostridiales bacterium]|nr:hypothetical protein [Clostridiales bacterium]